MLAAGLVFLSFALLMGFPFSGDFNPYGRVDYKGSTAPDGYEVVALIDDHELAHCEVENGRYSLTIKVDDPATQDKEGWCDGDLVTFRVNGQRAVPTTEALSGPKEANISVPSLGTELTTWGKIKALFR